MSQDSVTPTHQPRFALSSYLVFLLNHHLRQDEPLRRMYHWTGTESKRVRIAKKISEKSDIIPKAEDKAEDPKPVALPFPAHLPQPVARQGFCFFAILVVTCSSSYMHTIYDNSSSPRSML
ncbi:hypothetical protein MGYG_04404 [Nannizzia gypsea CBS 118893]|uniref:Uncharacterized protein n=1 Tax=Arthroderma gypseum (strain ATCC MYA-4604 / CBS 118893) TaxID=535722 RepID=E4USU8_ARTGP|nr:hypothetical protein MGYG_04404 [Nannizzia gypsea CBS 118893]EFR01397.1 hypothetical protein MGYG_04404 [Nannizzia gypsea CBS 118893]